MGEAMPRHVLHVGNILNNGYLHAKYLRRHGVGAEVLNLDDIHCQAQPEWTEVHVTEPVAQWGQDWSSLDLGGYRRPDWYHGIMSGQLPDLARQLVCPQTPAAAPPVIPPSGRLTEMHYALRRAAAAGLRGVGLGGMVGTIRDGIRLRRLKASGLNAAEVSARINRLIADFRHAYPDAATPLCAEDVHEHLPRAVARAPVFTAFSLIQAYSLDPIHALLGVPGQPFICYEHGTMRDFPFEDSSRGRLYALALKKAEVVFITNVDCIASARRLGLDNWSFIPHLIDDDRFRPGISPLRTGLLAEAACDHLILCPARHHWKNAPPGLGNSFFKGNDILIRGLAMFRQQRPHLRVAAVFFEFGEEVELSRQLIGELGLSDRVLWRPIQSKPSMCEYYRAADLVCDQFHAEIRAFGAVVGEAMACGKPMVSNLDAETNSWGFPVLPPVQHALTPEAVCGHLLALFDNPDFRSRLGERSLEWYRAHHSSQIVIGRMIDAYHAISERHGWGWRFR